MPDGRPRYHGLEGIGSRDVIRHVASHVNPCLKGCGFSRVARATRARGSGEVGWYREANMTLSP